MFCLRRILFEEDSGQLKLYHFSSINPAPESFVLDPEFGRKNPKAYSRRDYATSNVPRVWFYTNPAEAEDSVKAGSTLYTTEVSRKDICELNDLIKMYKEKNPGMPVNVDEMLRMASGWKRLNLHELPYDPLSSTYDEEKQLLLTALEIAAKKSVSGDRAELIRKITSEVFEVFQMKKSLTDEQRARIAKLFLGGSKEVKLNPICRGIRFRQAAFDNVIWFEPIQVYKANS
jgi:hypothetical protein